MTLTRRELADLLEAHGLHPSRALGQNFVADPNTVRRIARLAELAPGEPVVEIGAGLGSLTLALAETGAVVTAVEMDRKLLPLLRAQVESHGVHVVEADARTVDLERLLADAPGDATGGWALVANLPYNVAVPIVMRVLDETPRVRRLLVMVQREVGERLAASAGDHAYGAVSVKVAYHASARVVGRVPATVFVPRPRVESVLVGMERRPAPAVDPAVVSPDRLFAVVRAGFAQRRKMLRRSLAGVVPLESFEPAGIDPQARAEDLSVEDWGRLVACSE
ncbi:MAG TPA: 16S rRNA (adenine(1518)-N(6)/adenine(1519)-N(6))-dimethyltransferase RsmA [Acidimicrobiales bacterium]|nr:16S rRNA (adenine(1518)-N(6)/adenine(1519)-N(6))-dimethyltransferase RsmA [Acidimicrobiales bacterium]